VVTPEILHLLKTQKGGKDGEIRLADAFITHLKQDKPIYGKVVEGKRFDCGNKLEFMEAAVHFGLKHPEVNGDGAFSKYLAANAKHLPAGKSGAKRPGSGAKPAKRR
jgi:UTP--glucose-1-phosphate uridylyltransferase